MESPPVLKKLLYRSIVQIRRAARRAFNRASARPLRLEAAQLSFTRPVHAIRCLARNDQQVIATQLGRAPRTQDQTKSPVSHLIHGKYGRICGDQKPPLEELWEMLMTILV